MISQFYDPLPDIDKALDRIGCAGLEVKHDIETLDRLICSFLTHVPYENLNVTLEHREPSLETLKLYDKFVLHRRGGYCLEMNGFFWVFLRDLGFNVHSVSAYVLEYHDDMGDLGHRANVINIDGSYYLADVGFGGRNIAYHCVPLDGSEKNGFFVMYNEEAWEYTLCKIVNEESETARGNERFIRRGMCGGREVSYIEIILFRNFKAYPQEFYLTNLAFQHLSGNPMLENRIVNMRSENGDVYTVYNDTFKITNSEGHFERKIRDDAELKEICEKYYGMIFE